MANKSKNLEIEIRGSLTKPSLSGSLVKKITRQNKTAVQETKQVIIFYKENDKDFRIKWDDDKESFKFVHKTKSGLQRTMRDEFTITIDKKEINDFLVILKELGLKKGFISPTHRIDITTPFVVWSFKLGSVIGNYWEAEATSRLFVKFKNKKNKVKKYLENTAKSYGLLSWSDEEFKKVRQEKWHKVKPLKNSKILKILQNGKY